jgi:AbrB family looped-hinge helix DNA binding protein
MWETRTRLGQGGRLVIPGACREAMGVNPGDELVVSVNDGELRVMTVAQAIRRAQALVRQYVPDGSSLVDELLTERRSEAERD